MPNGTKTCLLLYNILIGDGKEDEELNAVDQVRTEIAAVRNALKDCGYTVRTMGLRYLSAKVITEIDEVNPDFIFNLVESVYAQSRTEMYIAGLFELLKIPYTGSPPLALGLALNKLKTKQILRAASIPVPPSVIAIPGESPNFETLTPPYIIKPIREDGSSGISPASVTDDLKEVKEKITYIHETFHQPALIEEFIDGREFNVSVIGNNPPRMLAVAEIDFSKMPKKEPRIVSYEAKWRPQSPQYIGTEVICPAEIDSYLRARIEKIALKSYKELGCRDYARIDIRLGEGRRLYVIEVNTNPDIAPESGVVKARRLRVR